MSLFFSKRESRAVTDWAAGVMGDAATSSGETVTTNKAFRHAAVWSSVHLLASIVSNLPVDVFRGSGVSKQPVSPPQLVREPSLIVTRREWLYQGMVSLLMRGNAFGFVVERDSFQRPVTVEWLDPDSVTVDQASQLSRPTYRLGTEPIRNREDVIHMRAYLRPGSAVGMSPVEYHAEKIGVGLAAEKFGAQFYGSGGHPTALFQNTQQTVDPDKARVIKERIRAVLKGAREPLVLGADWEYKPLQVKPAESEFIASQGYTDAQIARLYGPGLAEVLGYTQSGSSLTYSNRVDRSLDLLTYSVMQWVGRFEDMWTANIAQPHTVRFNVSAMLRADPKSQMEMFRVAREIGLYSIDEERGLLDLPPLPDGAGEDYTPLKSAAPARQEDTDGNE